MAKHGVLRVNPYFANYKTGRFLRDFAFPEGKDVITDDDWFGQGRKLWHIDMDWESIVKPTSENVLGTDRLIDDIPVVTRSKGKAGVEVAPDVAEKIEGIWAEHLRCVNNVISENSEKKPFGGVVNVAS